MSDLIGPDRRSRSGWTATDYLLFAAVAAFVVAVVAGMSASAGHDGLATVVLAGGGLLVGSWWLIGCAAIGTRVALRERDGRD